MKVLTVGSLFAGIGGIDLGFSLAGFTPVWANEIDEFCAKTFKSNFHDTSLVVDDIHNIIPEDIPPVDVLTAGFPCQAFSVAGYRKGFSDDRGMLIYEVFRLLDGLKNENSLPKVLFLENVKNLYTHNKGNTYKEIKQELAKYGYSVIERVLNTSSHGNLPQNRERLYIVCFLDKEKSLKFRWPSTIPLTNTLDKVLRWGTPVDQKYYYTKDSICYPLLHEYVKKKYVIYQYRRVYVRENKNKVCPTLTANMGMGGHNVPIIMTEDGVYRKLTPRECLSLQGFPDSYIVPRELCDAKVYKQAGNSVSVSVISRIAESILRAYNE